MIQQKQALAYGGAAKAGAHEPATLAEALARAAQQNEEKGIIYLQPDGTQIAQSYAALCEEAAHLLAGLRALGLRPGDPVILQVEENQHYLPTFWACVLGGLVVVPISIAPSYAQPGVVTTKLQKAWELCERPLIVASAGIAPELRALAPALDMTCARIETVQALRARPSTPQERAWHPVQPDDVFMILFTSGSTGLPKGVMLTHRNVLSLARGYTRLEGLTSQERTFNWMPLDHIGGLVAFHLRDVYLGCQQIQASPQTILQEPLRWLDCLDRYRATCTWAPNFAYSLVNERLASVPARSWDLSALRHILNAGEAIVPKTARRFLAMLGPYGLRSTAIHPSWGMSETSSGVTFSSSFSLETTSDDDRFVDAGALIAEVRVRIVDDQNRILEEGESGRIQVRGPTVTPGYYRNPALNQEVFTEDGWFDTGDVGFLRGGRLTITGRTKNIIIINGLNYYCQEIEAVVEEVAGVKATFTGACAVRSSADNTDGLAIFYCTDIAEERALLKQCQEIRRRVVSAVGINPSYLLPLEQEDIPKTETGKIQRNKLKRRFEEGAFADLCARMDRLLAQAAAPVASDAEIDGPGGEVERELLLLWRRVFNRPALGRHEDFFEAGGDSLILMRLLARVQERFAVALPPRSVFDFPTVETLARHILRCQEETRAGQMPPLLPVARQGVLPLSFAQQRLWFLDQLNPGSVAYSVCGSFRLQGPLRVPVLQRSLQEIVRRHESLRSSFPARNGAPALVLAPHLEIALALIDLEAPEGCEVEERLTREIRRPFDLARGPLARFTLLRLAEEEHMFLAAFHHMVVDGWSMDLFYRELEALYAAFGRDEASPLPDLPVQYVDFACWQRQWLRGEILERELGWWTEHLRGAPALLALPTDHPRPAIQSDHGAHVSVLLPSELLQRLKSISQAEGATLFITLLSAFNVLLYRYSGQEDLVVGTFVADRGPAQAVEALIGYFANTLPLRTKLSGRLPFRELLRRVREATLEAYSHQDVPFDQLVDALQLERNLSYQPLVQAMLVLQNQQMFTLELEGISATPWPFESRAARFDLLFELVETGAGLRCQVEYQTDLFEDETIRRMLVHWQNLLEEIVRHPERRIADLALLGQAEREQILRAWNDAETEIPDLCMHQLFAAQAAATPHAVAVRYERQRLTYRDLDEQANQLAHYLRLLGVGPEVLVGIYVERCPEMLIGLLGILKAGGAYVPLDPLYPQERLAYMVADAQLSVILTQERLLASLPEQRARVVCLDADRARFLAQETNAPAVVVDPAHPAYVMYTSGSTGRPKGVQIPQRALTNFLLSMSRQPGITAQDRLLAVTTLSFDIAGLELYLPLINGAQVILAGRAEAADGGRLARLIEASAASMMQATPATWRLLLEAGWVGDPGLRVLCGGEAFPRPLAEQLLACCAEVWNMYGPTETTIWSTLQRVASTDEGMSIGRPIANTRAYVLDRDLNPVPVGVPGELYLGGRGLARGYLKRPDLTAERFLPDPFSRVAGERLYRTGDLARYLPDGRLECLGRVDHQVKVRGFRIELGEIEAALARHPGVRECVVLVREDRPGDQRLVEKIGDQRLVAYIVPGEEPGPDGKTLRAFLKETLPDYMLPVAYIKLEGLPLTPNGKVDRRALLALDETRVDHRADVALPRTSLEHMLVGIWRDVLGIEQVGLQDNFFDLGGHSLLLVRVQSKVQETLRRAVSITDLFQYPTISALVQFLVQDSAVEPAQLRGDGQARVAQAEAIAVIGMAGRFPGAATLDEFWANLCNGVESIVAVSPEELLKDGIDATLISDASYVRMAALMDDVEMFDAAFFGYSPREAELIDPQQRLFLECAWQALEHAGYSSDSDTADIGVYGSTSPSSYKAVNPGLHLHPMESVDGYEVMLGNANDFLTTRVSYKLGLRGPSLNIQTACSSSLVAIHKAAQDLLEGKCQMALAGGVAIHYPLKSGYRYYEGGILSPDGHCRAFDADARGTVPGNGLGVVVLKRLADALADRDTIYAVIKGSAINNDGAVKVGFTAPSVQGQAAVIGSALQRAGIAAETVSYIETHGTGTALGDPIEIEALKRAFVARTEKKGFCAIGSVKTNIGHADIAAGIAGFLKTVLALHHRWLPPSLHYQRPNPQIDFADSPFYVNTQSVAWEAGGSARRAGVSSFGIGGTNAHVVLEEAPALTLAERGPEKPWHVLVFSARTPSALQTVSTQLAQHLRERSELSLADVAYTLQVGRKVMKQRQMLVCRDRDEAIEILDTRDPRRLVSGPQATLTRAVAFLFPGQGAQYVAMAEELYQHEPVFREQIDRCAELLIPYLGGDIRQVLYPDAESHACGQLDQTRFAQPALFMVEYALARLWMAWGIHPQAMLGHSIGEYVAASLAGVFSLEDALMLVSMRGHLMQQLPGGMMLAVSLSEEELLPWLGAGLSLAAVNAADQCVVAGSDEAMMGLEKALAERDIQYRRLQTSHAFHSPMMRPMIRAFTHLFSQVRLQAPRIPYISNVTGTWISAEQACSAQYWAEHILQTVRFADGLQLLRQTPGRVLLEVGPGHTLGSLARQQENEDAPLVLATLGGGKKRLPDYRVLLTALGQLWLSGCQPDWQAVHAPGRPRRVPLPTYPFERQRYRVSAPPVQETAGATLAVSTPQGDVDNWFYLPSWKRCWLPGPAEQEHLFGQQWLVFCHEGELAKGLIARLERANQRVIRVLPGVRMSQQGERTFTLDPRNSADYQELLQELRRQNALPGKILHMWSITDPTAAGSDAGDRPQFEQSQDQGFYSLLFLAQALGEQSETDPVHILVLSNTMHAIGDEAALHPEQATISGVCNAINQEYAHLSCQSIDLLVPFPGSRQEQRLWQQLLKELATAPTTEVVAYRGAERWVRSFERVQLPDRPVSSLRERGVYLLTGGLGGIGLTLAHYLARQVQARLVLLGRSSFPAEDGWSRWLAGHDEHDAASQKIRQLRAMQELGAEVMIVEADVTSEQEMRAAATRISERFGPVNGIIHAAGVPGNTRIQNKTRAQAEQVLAPKVRGTQVLATVFQQAKLDFLILCSSVSALAGGFGQADYSGANAYLDAFAHYNTLVHDTPTLSINWDLWQTVGMSARTRKEGDGQGDEYAGIVPEQAVEAFARVLDYAANAQFCQIMISAHDLQTQRQHSLLRRERWQKAQEAAAAVALPPMTEGEPAYQQLEQQLMIIWRRALGLSQVGLDDDFFDLGGDSLASVRMVALARSFGIRVTQKQILECPTIAELARAIEREEEHNT